MSIKRILESSEDELVKILSETGKDSEDSLKRERTCTQYLINGNSFVPYGPIRVAEKLQSGVYKVNSSFSGVFFDIHEIKTDELLRFSDSRYSEVLSEVNKFWGLKPTFEKYGFSHKRGLLLYGDPGTGKSCLIKLVIEDVVRDGNLVLLASRSSSTLVNGLAKIRDIEPDRKILVVLEDIDEICSYDEHSILELFDGSDQVDGVLYLGTTNHLNKIPPRIRRTGRFDRCLEIGVPPKEGRFAYLKSKLNGIESDNRIIEIADKTKGFNFSQLREFVVGTFCLGYSEDSVVKRIKGGEESYNISESNMSVMLIEKKNRKMVCEALGVR